VLAFILRFIGAGLIAAALPAIARGFNDQLAGIVLLFPVVTVSGFLVLGLDRGVHAVAQASGASVITLPAVLVFLSTVHVAARQQRPLVWVLVSGLAGWVVTAVGTAAITGKARSR